MAETLVKKIAAIPLWEEEWKLITLMVGQSDLCAHTCNASLKSQVRSNKCRCGGGIHNQTVRQAVEYCTCISVVWRDARWNKGRYTDEEHRWGGDPHTHAQ